MENLREERWDFCQYQCVLNRTYKTGGYEQARNANFRQIDQDVSVELLLLDQNIFTDMAERIS
jgi:hypothetical protein